jgi:small subunit ribosomal protein S10
MKVKVLINLKSFEPKCCAPRLTDFTSQKVNSEGLRSNKMLRTLSTTTKKGQFTQKSSTITVALPKRKSIYTVLRSPHIDKKSREQFEMTVFKQLIIVNTEIRNLQEKLFNLRFHEMPGVQMKVTFQTKTRLKLKRII